VRIGNESAAATQNLIAQGIRSESRMSVRPAKPGQLLNTSRGDVLQLGNGARLLDVGNGVQNLQSLSQDYAPRPLRRETQINLAGLKVEWAVSFTPQRPTSASVQAIDSPELVNGWYGSITDPIEVYP
jgi:hypothetical protein